MLIKRVKVTPAGPDGKPGPFRTHWAAKVEPAGNVSGWTDKSSAAVSFSVETALRVLDFYKAKKPELVGAITAEDEAKVEPPKAVAAAPKVESAPPTPKAVLAGPAK